MAQNPPPGPGWTLGDDGHWKPPSLFGPRPPAGPSGPPDAGSGATPVGGSSPVGPWAQPSGTAPEGAPPAAPSPWNPNPAPAAPDWSTAAGAPAGPGPWTAPPAPGPAPKASSPARIALIVIGGVAAGGMALVMLLIGAVTFLGTSSESKFEPVGSQIASGDPDDEGTFVPVGPPINGPAEEPVDPGDTEDLAPALEEAVGGIGFRLEDGGWELVDDGELAPGANELPSCLSPPQGGNGGWYMVWEHPELQGRGLPGVPDLGIEIISYASEAGPQAALGELTSEAWRACLTDVMAEALPAEATSRLELLPGDAGIPGVGYAIVIESPGGATITVNHLYLPVGSMLAHVSTCGCAPDEERSATQEVAAALAEAQGLPVPR